MGIRAEAIVTDGRNTSRQNISLSGAIVDTAECGKSLELESIRDEMLQLNAQLDLMKERTETLRSEMIEQRKKIAAAKAQNAQRRSDAGSAKFNLEDRSNKELEIAQSSIRRKTRRWNLVHQEIINRRAISCRDAAQLAGLERRKYSDEGRIVHVYTIGHGWLIPDLRDLRDVEVEKFNASITHVTVLTQRIANYLGLRLPAEIISPQHDCSLPTILSPEASYAHRAIIFPKLPGEKPTGNSPATSRILETRPTSKARPVFLTESLTKLLKDDPTAFGMFIEGISLLAWDIAWLCKTQGMENFTSWKDVCNMGENFWRLLSGPSYAAGTVSDAESQRSGDKARISRVPTTFGLHSHATAHTFFGSDAIVLMDEWKLRPAEVMRQCIMKIRQHLINTIRGPEWEVIDSKEGANDYDDLARDEPVLIPKNNLSNGGLMSRKLSSAGVTPTPRGSMNANSRRFSANFSSRSGMDLRHQAMEGAAATNRLSGVQTRRDSIGTTLEEGVPSKGQSPNNGWMKVRNRNSSIVEGSGQDVE